MQSVKVRAPATVANLGCGFDVLGVCIDKPFDEVEVEIIQEPIVKLDILHSEYKDIPNNHPYRRRKSIPINN